MLNTVITFFIDTLITGVFLWLGMKAVALYMGMGKGAVYCAYWQLVVAAGVSALTGLVPIVGWLLSWATLLGLMMYFADAGFFEVLLMVIVAKVSSLLALFLLMPVIVG